MKKERNLVRNIIFNFIKTFNSILFPIITFAYSSRILGVEGVGKVNFAKSVITYFTMLAMLGMNYYGTREAAKLSTDRERLSIFSAEMLVINGCMTLLSYFLLAVLMVFVSALHEYYTLILICSLAIVLQGMGMEWLYQAMEEYQYIAIRSVLFQLVSLIAMFIFVRDEGDVEGYAFITVIASSGSYILNFFNAKNYIHLHSGMELDVIKHLKPLLWLFSMNLSIELYTVLDTSMLGFLKGDTAVGFYTAAIKVERMINTLIASIGVVLIPRISIFIEQGDKKKVSGLVKTAYNYVFMLSIPAAVGLLMLSKEIIFIFSGKQFASAGITMRILTPIVILIPFSVVTNQQTFVPLGKEKLILMSTGIGAVTNFTLNSLLIPKFAENGAAVATVVAEAAVAAICYMNASRLFDMKQVFSSYHHYWIASSCIPVVCLLINLIDAPLLISTALKLFFSCVVYFLCLSVLKNDYFLDIAKIVMDKFWNWRGRI